jgi:hypothetical protein
VIENEGQHVERGRQQEVVTKDQGEIWECGYEIAAAATYIKGEETLGMASRRFASLPTHGL